MPCKWLAPTWLKLGLMKSPSDVLLSSPSTTERGRFRPGCLTNGGAPPEEVIGGGEAIAAGGGNACAPDEALVNIGIVACAACVSIDSGRPAKACCAALPAGCAGKVCCVELPVGGGGNWAGGVAEVEANVAANDFWPCHPTGAEDGSNS